MPFAPIRVILLLLAFCFLGKPSGNCTVINIEKQLVIQLANNVVDHDAEVIKVKKHKLLPSISHPQRRHQIARRRVSISNFFSDSFVFSDSFTVRNFPVTDEYTSKNYCFNYFIRPFYYVHLFRCALFWFLNKETVNTSDSPMGNLFLYLFLSTYYVQKIHFFPGNRRGNNHVLQQ
jgi:hypothetical protein